MGTTENHCARRSQPASFASSIHHTDAVQAIRREPAWHSSSRYASCPSSSARRLGTGRCTQDRPRRWTATRSGIRARGRTQCAAAETTTAATTRSVADTGRGFSVTFRWYGGPCKINSHGSSRQPTEGGGQSTNSALGSCGLRVRKSQSACPSGGGHQHSIRRSFVSRKLQCECQCCSTVNAIFVGRRPDLRQLFQPDLPRSRSQRKDLQRCWQGVDL